MMTVLYASLIYFLLALFSYRALPPVNGFLGAVPSSPFAMGFKPPVLLIAVGLEFPGLVY
jgi:hypothetical protein